MTFIIFRVFLVVQGLILSTTAAFVRMRLVSTYPFKTLSWTRHSRLLILDHITKPVRCLLFRGTVSLSIVPRFVRLITLVTVHSRAPTWLITGQLFAKCAHFLSCVDM